MRTAILLFIILFLAGFANFPLTDTQVPGTYHSYFTPGRDGGIHYYLTMKKDGTYEELLKKFVRGKKSRTRITGTWTLQGDTVYIFPKKTRGSINSCNCPGDDEWDKLYCAPDTFIFKNGDLWSTWPYYKEFTRQ